MLALSERYVYAVVESFGRVERLNHSGGVSLVVSQFGKQGKSLFLQLASLFRAVLNLPRPVEIVPVDKRDEVANHDALVQPCPEERRRVRLLLAPVNHKTAFERRCFAKTLARLRANLFAQLLLFLLLAYAFLFRLVFLYHGIVLSLVEQTHGYSRIACRVSYMEHRTVVARRNLHGRVYG